MCTSAFAQRDTGRISGTIKDEQTKRPLTEAVVTLKSGVLEGQKFAVTDTVGHYKINNLPSGNYSISFEMEGYQKFSQEKILLKEGASLIINYEMAKSGNNRRQHETAAKQ